MEFLVKSKGPGSIKGSGKNTLGADKRGRGHWRHAVHQKTSEGLKDVTPPDLRERLVKKPVDNYRAVGLAEGFEEGTEEEIQEAWQHLIDSGMVNHLQGWFGRTAQSLIERGVCRPPRK